MAKKKEKSTSTTMVEVGDKKHEVEVKFGVTIPDMAKTYTKEELLADPEAVAYLVEIKSGAVAIVEPLKAE